MTTAEYAAAVRAGRSVTDIAVSAGVSPVTVYSALRRARTPVSALRAKRRRIEYRELPGRPGYRVGADGSVQSCVSTRTGALTPYWRDLTIRRVPTGGPIVQIGATVGDRRERLSLRRLIESAWGPDSDRVIGRCLAFRTGK